jgi:O-antigen/teichoic acid export membrane protein
LLPVVVGLAIVARPFAAVVSGHDFEGVMGGLIPLLMVSRGLNVFSQFYLHLGFQIVEKPMRQVVCGAATLIINVAMNFVLTRCFGLTGAAVALVIADLGGVVVSFLLLHPVFPMPFPPTRVAVIAVSVSLMALGCEITMSLCAGMPALLLLVGTMAVGILVYAATVFVFDICHAKTLLMSRDLRSWLGQPRQI